MRRRDLILGGAAALLACATPTLALTPAQQLVLFSAKPLYTGPGDIVSGWTAWYGLRAYNAAVCGTGAQKAVNVRRNTDNATQDILILPSTCGVDTASATTFAGTYSATGTIASTVWTVTAVSGTPITVGDTISGTGVTAGSTVVSNGTGTGGTGTYNLNVASTVSVGETMNATHGLFIAKAYDQSGNGHDVAQATAANQPQLLLSGGTAGLPYVSFSGSQSLVSVGFGAIAQPWTVSVIAMRSGANITQWVMGTNAVWDIGFSDSAARMAASTSVVTSQTINGTFHALQYNAIGASSFVSIDGVASSPAINPGIASITTAAVGVGANSAAGSPFTGRVFEIGAIAGLTTAQIAALNANQHAIGGGW